MSDDDRLEPLLAGAIQKGGELLAEIEELKKDRKRYREALEKIANAEEVGYPGSRMTMVEAQSIAMGALSNA